MTLEELDNSILNLLNNDQLIKSIRHRVITGSFENTFRDMLLTQLFIDMPMRKWFPEFDRIDISILLNHIPTTIIELGHERSSRRANNLRNNGMINKFFNDWAKRKQLNCPYQTLPYFSISLFSHVDNLPKNLEHLQSVNTADNDAKDYVFNFFQSLNNFIPNVETRIREIELEQGGKVSFFIKTTGDVNINHVQNYFINN